MGWVYLELYAPSLDEDVASPTYLKLSLPEIRKDAKNKLIYEVFLRRVHEPKFSSLARVVIIQVFLLRTAGQKPLVSKKFHASVM